MSSATSIRSGELRQCVQFMEDVGERIAGGSVEPDFRPVGNPVPCKVEPLSGGKSFLAQQAQSKVTHTITLRYRSGISPHWRIKWGTRVFEIARVIDVEERRRKIEISAIEVT